MIVPLAMLANLDDSLIGLLEGLGRNVIEADRQSREACRCKALRRKREREIEREGGRETNEGERGSNRDR